MVKICFLMALVSVGVNARAGYYPCEDQAISVQGIMRLESTFAAKMIGGQEILRIVFASTENDPHFHLNIGNFCRTYLLPRSARTISGDWLRST